MCGAVVRREASRTWQRMVLLPVTQLSLRLNFCEALLYFLQEMIRSSFRTFCGSMCSTWLLKSLTADWYCSKRLDRVLRLEVLGLSWPKLPPLTLKSLCLPLCSWVLTEMGDPGGIRVEEWHGQTSIEKALWLLCGKCSEGGKGRLRLTIWGEMVVTCTGGHEKWLKT